MLALKLQRIYLYVESHYVIISPIFARDIKHQQTDMWCTKSRMESMGLFLSSLPWYIKKRNLNTRQLYFELWK